MYLPPNSETDDFASYLGAKEARIWGPPGCGKTTYLKAKIAGAAEKCDGKDIIVTSHTRAAAAELASRGLLVPDENIGTVHALCYRAEGRPDIAELHIDEWNRENPGLRLFFAESTVDEAAVEEPNTGLGDDLYSKLQLLRASFVPVERWPEKVRRFGARWTAWKDNNSCMDFTDLLEVAHREIPVAPGEPSIIFVDEAQDLSELQLAVLRNWGSHADSLVMAGDDDQTIYGFAGASPEVLLNKTIPLRFRLVLKQSYRVPRHIHAVSQEWIKGVALREPKEYFPRDADGEVRVFHKGHYKYPELVVEDAERYLSLGRTVMFLAPCSYMLEPVKAVLRNRGLPFHNPYRRKRRDWNPLALPVRNPNPKTTKVQPPATALERLLSFLRPHRLAGRSCWSADDLHQWFKSLKGGVLAPGAHEFIKTMTETIRPYQLRELLEPNPFAELSAAMSAPLLNLALEWWLNHLKPAFRRAAEYPVRIMERGGVTAVHNRPRIIIGTAHSVKGGEADVVYLFPDLSASGIRGWEGGRHERDSIIRLGYVMMTRARESIVICEPAGVDGMPIARAAAKVMRGGNR